MKMFIIAALTAIFLTIHGCRPTTDWQTQLRTELQAYTDTLDAQIGIALLLENGDSLTLNNRQHYEMMSVFKFHQALAVCNYLYRHNQSLDTLLHITPADLKPNTWSPLRDRYLQEELVDGMDISVRNLLVRNLLEYTLQQSDNNACDILFDRLVSPAETDRFIRNLGLTEDFGIAYTEAEMQKDHHLSKGNWSTPYAAASLLKHFLETDLIKEPYKAFIKETMTSCQTGMKRLPAPLHDAEAIIGHKTGSGYTTADGRIGATNDLGFITLSDGTRYILAVFVKDSGYNATQTEEIIGQISQIVFNHLQKY